MQGRSPARAVRATAGAVSAWLLVVLALPATARATDPTPTSVPAVAAPARQAPLVPELALTWQAPAGCPSSGEVQAQFARLLGGAARTPSGKHIMASLVVRSSSSDRWSLELATTLDGAAGRRNLDGETCASVASAAALILALMIDPAAAERAVEESTPAASAPPAPTKPPTTTVTAAPVAERESAPPRPPRAALGFARVFAGGVAAFLPTLAPAAGLAFGARHGRLAAELSGVATEERHADTQELAGAGGDFRLMTGGARACGELGGRAVVWQACLGGELERLSGTGTGAGVTPRTKTVLMGAATGGLLVTLPLASRLALSLDLDAAVRAYHPKVDLDLTTRIFQIPWVSAFAALGIVITI